VRDRSANDPAPDTHGGVYFTASGHLGTAIDGKAFYRRGCNERFPEDFMLRLSAAEYAALISQIATSKSGSGGRRKLPWAFTEHGAIQAANVLNSPRAIAMGVHVVRAFVQLRELLASNRELARRFDQLEARLDKKLAAHDEAITAILSAIRELMNPPAPNRRGIGFTANIEEKP
jgi:hypothetical protein